MRFEKRICFQDTDEEKELIRKTEIELSSTFMELSLHWDQDGMSGSRIGGDALQMQLIVPLPHYCDLTSYHQDKLTEQFKSKVLPSINNNKELNKEQLDIISKLEEFKKKNKVVLRTAATDGKSFYWCPQFILSLSKIGKRLVVAHETGHAYLMHPNRIGHRILALWNIAVDFKIHYLILQDLLLRGTASRVGETSHINVFTKHIGEFITLEEYASLLRDPYNPPPRLAELGPTASLKNILNPNDKPATIFYYAEPNLPDHLRQPEAIYDYLLNQIPKCPECSKMGFYKKSQEYKDLEKQLGEKNNNNSNNSCSTCGGADYEYLDLFGMGETLDHHMSVDITETELTQRLSDAIEVSSKLGGRNSLGLEEELGELVAPQLVWEDFARDLISKKREGGERNDWSNPRTRQLCAGLYTPKKKDYLVNILVAYDCSASMDVQQDIAYGLSQIQCLDDRCVGTLVSWDTQVFWSDAVKITSAKPEQLKQAKVIGRGGTVLGSFFSTYEENVGPVDIIIIITDGFIADLEKLKKITTKDDTAVIWLITRHNPGFAPGIGRVFHLYNE